MLVFKQLFTYFKACCSVVKKTISGKSEQKSKCDCSG
jgi:hypothetical protein